MRNCITHVEVRNRSLAPAEAEVWVTVRAETVTAATEVRGRLMGPSCPYSSTVEVAYPLRPLVRPTENAPPLTMRVVVPEASLWEPESPFLYQGPVELWQDGERRDRVTVRHGLCSWSLTSRGLRWNGKRLTLRGRAARELTDDNAMSLRWAGVNLLLASADEPAVWDLADRLGFLVLGELSTLDAGALDAAEKLAPHPSCFGWLVNTSLPTQSERLASLASGKALGARAESPEAIPPWATFIVCDAGQAARFTGCDVPLLTHGRSDTGAPPAVGSFL
jgi:hypothetical protein